VFGIPPGKKAGSGGTYGFAFRTVCDFFAEDLPLFFLEVGAATAVVQRQHNSVTHSCQRQTLFRGKFMREKMREEQKFATER
jgi:hypothetical protein